MASCLTLVMTGTADLYYRHGVCKLAHGGICWLDSGTTYRPVEFAFANWPAHSESAFDNQSLFCHWSLILVTHCTDGARVPNPPTHMTLRRERWEGGRLFSTSCKPIQMAEDETYHSSGPPLEADVSVQTLEAVGPLFSLRVANDLIHGRATNATRPSAITSPCPCFNLCTIVCRL